MVAKRYQTEVFETFDLKIRPRNFNIQIRPPAITFIV